MPRSNRPRGRRPGDDDDEFDVSRVLIGRMHTESKRDGSYNVQPLSGGNAAKTYTCPGCGLEIAPGTAHLVAWRADGILGSESDIADRRHWHTHCWRIRA